MSMEARGDVHGRLKKLLVSNQYFFDRSCTSHYCFHPCVEECNYVKLVRILSEIGFWLPVQTNVIIKQTNKFMVVTKNHGM